jgi:hypothetical protein
MLNGHHLLCNYAARGVDPTCQQCRHLRALEDDSPKDWSHHWTRFKKRSSTAEATLTLGMWDKAVQEMAELINEAHEVKAMAERKRDEMRAPNVSE